MSKLFDLIGSLNCRKQCTLQSSKRFKRKPYMLNRSSTIIHFYRQLFETVNELPMNTRNASSLNSFKYKLNTNIKVPPVYFNDGIRLGQIYHSRLRTDCSSLNSHLYAKHITDSPLCDCGEIEDSNHYLLQCNRYADLRRDMLNTVSTLCPPIINTLLWGNSELPRESNEELFLTVQNFILRTKRFAIQ